MSEEQVKWDRIRQSSDFQRLLSSKKKFIIPYVIFFMVFYFTLPVMTSYFTVLNEKAIGSLSWAFVFALAQFVMTWVLCLIYVKRADKFDDAVEQIKQQAAANTEKEASA